MDEPPAPEVRIGDRERRAVDAHLQQAHADGVLTLIEYDERAAQCWAARTRSELDALVRDLPPYRPGPEEAPTVAVPEPAAGSGRTVGQRLTRAVVGVLAAGAALFVGAQVVTADDAVVIAGDRAITAGQGTERIQIGSLFGDVRVIVPEGMTARTTGGLLFGDTRCDLACGGTGPEVVVDVTGAFSDIDVLRPGELTAEEAEEAAEEREDAIEEAGDEDD